MDVIFSPTSGRRDWSSWDVTDVREGRAIFSDYAERFCQAFTAKVYFVLNYNVVMTAHVLIKTNFDVLPKKMYAYLQQKVSEKHRQCCVLMVTSEMELFSFLNHGLTDIRKRKTATASSAATPSNSAKPKAFPATGQRLCVCSCSVYILYHMCFITECR